MTYHDPYRAEEDREDAAPVDVKSNALAKAREAKKAKAAEVKDDAPAAKDSEQA